jgi:transcriptional regulator with PAS, ATPase and Fis domain
MQERFGSILNFRSKIRLNIFFIILFVLTVFAGAPIFILTDQSFSNLDRSREILKETINTTVKEQNVKLYKTQAEDLSKRISDFLIARETDLKDFVSLSHSPELYLEFSKNNARWVNSSKEYKPLYKEIALIDESGQELIKIENDQLVPRDQLKNVSNPKNTRYSCETYFYDTKKSSSGIYVSRLASWYVSRQEQLNHEKKFDGVIRFSKKLKNPEGKFDGICSIALDAIHLLDFIDFRDIPKGLLVDRYKTGSYNYLVDDEGWIIAHQKLWDIKGFDREGNLVEALTDKTPQWKFDAGLIPINLLKMDWRLKDYDTQEPMSSVIGRVRRGETVITTMKSMGIHKEADAIVRTRAYAPIFYSTEPYKQYGIFGITMVGTSLQDFNDNSEILASQLAEINSHSKRRIYYMALIIFVAALFFSYLIARWISRPMNKLASTLVSIGKGEYSVAPINSPIEEINVLSGEVLELAGELEEKENKINSYVKDVELVNEKLAQAKKELSTYWHHEYEAESDTILEEKIKLYEEEYPILKELRKDKCIGISPAFLRVLRLVVPQSRMNIPTWIYGDSGVGKSSLAYAIHALSPRAGKPFFVFGASEFAAADPLIVLGKLFGYGPGHGLTGIDKNGQQGILEECDGGTLLIDDVDSLPLDTQSQLLRVIDGLDFHYAAGKSKSITVDVRFLFASNANLEQSVKDGLFRKDLYRRIGGSFNKIEIPPLRKRKADIPLLANYFIEKYSAKHNTGFKLTDGALNLLFKHKYKEGNIGELRTLIEIACESSRIEGEGKISKKHFPSLTVINLNPDGNDNNNGEDVFNENEIDKLSVLRDNNFRMDISEELLGFRSGSHTLSHYLRGMSLKALSHANWELDPASKLIVGPNLNGKTQALIKTKMKGYIRNITAKKNNKQETILYRNLPKEYHNFLQIAVDNFK